MNAHQLKQWCSQSFEITQNQFLYQRKPLILGILNVTSNSFSDGGLYLDVEAGYQRAQEMIAQGADILDLGAESSKPGVDPISADVELERLIPLIERIRATSDVCISIDTYKPEVMYAAVSAGASMINDIKALTSDGALLMASTLQVPICLMHMQGDPLTMQDDPHYALDIVDEINQFFLNRITACEEVGIPRNNLMIDPGFGFGKTHGHNLKLLNHLAAFHEHHLPLLLGVSRKSTIGAVLDKMVDERMIGGLAIAVFAALQGVSILRTHDVSETVQALKMLDAIMDKAVSGPN